MPLAICILLRSWISFSASISYCCCRTLIEQKSCICSTVVYSAESAILEGKKEMVNIVLLYIKAEQGVRNKTRCISVTEIQFFCILVFLQSIG